VLKNSRPPRNTPGADADSRTTPAATDNRPGRLLIAAMLLAAAALDLTRCGLALTTARHPVPTAGLAAAGLAAAAVSLRTALGCRAGQRWAGWAAFLIGAMSAPQAAASGFHAPYTIPDLGTAALGVLLAVAVLATAWPAGQPGHHPENTCVTTAGHPVIGRAAAPAHAHRERGPTAHRRTAAPGAASRGSRRARP
jgi:hypothetical protein